MESLSYIQNLILQKLITDNSVRYSDLHPAEVTQNLFNYHLGYLIEKGYILKSDDGYSLTDFGKKYVQRLDVSGNFKNYFRFSVVAMVVKEIDGKLFTLCQKRKRHPYKDDIYAGISGKVLPEEELLDAATRKFREETNLVCTDFRLLGVVRRIRYDSQHKLIEDTLYHHCLGYTYSGELEVENEYGSNEWLELNDIKEKQKANVTYHPNADKIIDYIAEDRKELFWWEEKLILENF